MKKKLIKQVFEFGDGYKITFLNKNNINLIKITDKEGAIIVLGKNDIKPFQEIIRDTKFIFDKKNG